MSAELPDYPVPPEEAAEKPDPVAAERNRQNLEDAVKNRFLTRPAPGTLQELKYRFTHSNCADERARIAKEGEKLLGFTRLK
ncbi:hypothetical protein HK097_006554 [Rhizophlyctis rosea]|uniref:Uncharacterized protein n=1 Tax=Rhizophlyctis rosea TaxID=64517 RepID=A0AAD5SEC5_9FUNG|nr:hypothetical protein HK097_006554 [Rhizophlyctis rosea]